jgi:predicted neuraminidase
MDPLHTSTADVDNFWKFSARQQLATFTLPFVKIPHFEPADAAAPRRLTGDLPVATWSKAIFDVADPSCRQNPIAKSVYTAPMDYHNQQRSRVAPITLVSLGIFVAGLPNQLVGASPAGLVNAEYVFTKAPHPECHASTIVECPQGLVSAWFGGTYEKHPDVGIWVSRKIAGKWEAPREVQNGVQENQTRHPCWNPVLFQPMAGPLLLFYKVGPSPETWWGMLSTSTDGGKTWSPGKKLPAGILGPVKNKPVTLASGQVLCGSSTEHNRWRVHLESVMDPTGPFWHKTEPLVDNLRLSAIQPTILQGAGDSLQILCRSRAGTIVTSSSKDGGETWTELSPTTLPNPNSGLDAVTLADGRHLLVYNHTQEGRSPLNVAISEDGKTWQAAFTLENTPGEYSYPAVIQSADGLVHITYTWKRLRVKHVVLDPKKLPLRPLDAFNKPG